MTRILIVGGVAGGATAAARIRRLDEQAEIIIFERTEYVSFANCGLPYHLGGIIESRDKLLLQTRQGFYDRYRVDVRLQEEVIAINTQSKTVDVKRLINDDNYTISYDKLLLAPGAIPQMPAADARAKHQIFSLHTMDDMDKLIEFIDQNNAKNAVVIGGGFIGLETAENLVNRGLNVRLLQRSTQVMPPLDADMAHVVHDILRKAGIDLMLSSPIKCIESKVADDFVSTENLANPGGHTGVVELTDTADITNPSRKNPDAPYKLKILLTSGEVLYADFIVAAIGVKPRSELAAAAGLELGVNAGIAVNEHMQTSDPNIYAVGDAVEICEFVTGTKRTVALAGPANKQARIAADNICGIESSYSGALGSAIIKVFNQTVAMTGINEKVACAQGLDYDKVYLFAGSHAGYYPGASDMLIKMLFERNTGRILGAQIIGKDGVDKRADTLATAIRAKMCASDIAQLEVCYAPPYASAKDPVNVLGLMVENLIEGRVRQFHWHDVEGLARDGSLTLLDVRSANEYQSGHIEGFINIPVDDLRARLNELDVSRPVFLHCHSGLRSYIAARILMQNGFNASHLSGGYRLYGFLGAQQSL